MRWSLLRHDFDSCVTQTLLSSFANSRIVVVSISIAVVLLLWINCICMYRKVQRLKSASEGPVFYPETLLFLNVCVSFVQGSISCIGHAPFAWLSQVNYLVSGHLPSFSNELHRRQCGQGGGGAGRPASALRRGQVRGNSSTDPRFNAVILCSILGPPTFPEAPAPPLQVLSGGQRGLGVGGSQLCKCFQLPCDWNGGSSFLIGRQHKPSRVVLGSCRGQKNASVPLKI